MAEAIVGAAYAAAVEVALWLLGWMFVPLARLVEFGGLAILLVVVLHFRSVREVSPKIIPSRPPDAVASASGGLVVVLVILAIGWPWYFLLAFPGGLDAGQLIPVAILAGVFVASGVYCVLIFGIGQIWLTESGAIVRAPFAPRFMVVPVSLETCSEMYIRGRRLWWGPPKKLLTSFVLWTSPTEFRTRVARLPGYAIVDAVGRTAARRRRGAS